MGGTFAKFGDSYAPRHDVEYCWALDRAKFSKQLKYVISISEIANGSKQMVPLYKYRIRWYEYDSIHDTWEPINRLTHIHILAHCTRNKIKIPNQIDLCITSVLSEPLS